MKPEFVLFGGDHLLALAAVAGFSALAYRAARGPRAEQWNRFGGGLFAALAAVLWLLRLDNGFQAYRDLPLWLCDVAFVLCVWCFFQPRRWVLLMVSYWGLAGTLQALVTPDLLLGFPSKEYFLFFVGHSVIVVGLFFLLGKNDHFSLASWSSVGQAFAGLLVYAVAVGALDAAFGWNYGYLREKPEGSSVLDFMGPWPWYIVAALGLALILFLLVAGMLRLLPKPRV